jgi:putative hydrolase of the HAD superfamily
MHSPSRPRALALDFGRVLTLDPDRTTFAPHLERLRIAPGEFFRAWAERRHEYDLGRLDAQGYWTGVLLACRPDLGLQEAAGWTAALTDADFASWARPRTALHRQVESAIDAGMLVAIVSNMPGGLGDRFVHTWPWLERIPHRFFSADFGKVKPDEEFYLHVLERTGWKAGDVLFVDDLPANIDAAARLGFRTLLFTGSTADLRTIRDWCSPLGSPNDCA